METSKLRTLAVCTLLCLLGEASNLSPLRAQEHYMSPGATVEDYTNALMQTRGLRPTSGTAARAQPTEPGSPPSSSESEGSGGVSVRVYFEFNSFALTPQSRKELDKLGSALASPEFTDDQWVIEGHTDASGSTAYNQRLSTRRAEAVYEYLVTRHGIEPSRMRPVGKGESELYDRANPTSGVNRRVRVRHAGG